MRSVPLYSLYASTYFMLGVQLPFFSGWLALKGFSAPEIGVLNGVALLLRIIAGPLIAIAADRRGRNAEALKLVALALASGAALLSLADWKPALAAAAIVMLAAFGVQFPLQDAMLLRADRAGVAPFGRVRSAGSFAFLIATLAVGEVLTRWGAAATAPVLAVMGIAVFASALYAPSTDETRPRANSAAGGFKGFVADRRLAGMFAASALVQGAHAAYYTFSILHWSGLGYQPREIGALWSIGVIVEIILLWRTRSLAERFRGETLLLVGAVGAVLRWLGIAAEPPLPVLFVVQTLHAASFALAYIGMMQFLRSRVDATLLGTAVATNSTLIAIVTGLAAVVAGFIINDSGGPAAYLLMALMAAGAAAIAVALTRRRDPDASNGAHTVAS